MEARVNQTKKELLEAGKKVQKIKDEAKSEFEKDDIKGENQAFQDWVNMNYPNLSAAYHEYEAADNAYTAALQVQSGSEGMKWQKEKRRLHIEKKQSDDQFEKVFVVVLPEE